MLLAKVLGPYLNSSPIIILDIGSRGGPHRRWYPLKGIARFFGFEPDASECRRLNSAQYPVDAEFLPYALGREDGKTESLSITRQPGCSSLYKPDLPFLKQFYYGPNLEVEREVSVQVRCLDGVREIQNARVDAIKIDTQGYELEILRGAKDTLRAVKLVELEVEFSAMYTHQPLFADVDVFMRDQGFFLLGLRRTSWRRIHPEDCPIRTHAGGQIIHGDVLYAKLPTDDLADHIRMIALLSRYRQDDFVADLLFRAKPVVDALSRSERVQLAEALLSQRPSAANAFLWFTSNALAVLTGLRTNRQWRKVVDNLRLQNAEAWHDPDFY